MKRLFIAFILISPIFFLISCNSPTLEIKEWNWISIQNEEKQIKETFNKYKLSILNDKWENAVNYLDKNTIVYYENLLNLVKNADYKKISSLSAMDKLMILLIRHRVTKEEIFSFNWKDLIIYSIKKGMVGKDSVSNASIWEVSVNLDFANGELLTNWKRSSLYFHFHKENNIWKLDLTSIFDTSNMTLKEMIKKSWKTEDDFMFQILESINGEKPNSKIWEPLKI